MTTLLSNTRAVMMLPRADESFIAMSFPCKMYSLLEEAEAFGFQDIISWQQGGKSFKIHNPEKYETAIMQSYFTQAKFRSFIRQINLYGFKKVPVGPNKGGYYHESFVRGSPQLCANIARSHRERRPAAAWNKQKIESSTDSLDFSLFWDDNNNDTEEDVKRTSVLPLRTTSNDQRLVMETSWSSSSSSMQLEESEVTVFGDFLYPLEQADDKQFTSNKLLSDNNETTTLLTDNNKSSTFCGSSSYPASCCGHVEEFQDSCNLFDFGGEDMVEFVSILEAQAADIELSSSSCSSSSSVMGSSKRSKNSSRKHSQSEEQKQKELENCFPYKLHLMLENARRDSYNHIVSWVNNGKAFKVHRPQEFVEQVLPMYFDQSKMESFRKQLNLYKFTRQAKGVDRGVISHPYLMEGARWLCDEIRKARHL